MESPALLVSISLIHPTLKASVLPCAALHFLESAHRIVVQDDLYRADYYQSLMEFREQTYQRLQKYAAQQFFKTHHYLSGTPPPPGAHKSPVLVAMQGFCAVFPWRADIPAKY
jgi:hypothetical protein